MTYDALFQALTYAARATGVPYQDAQDIAQDIITGHLAGTHYKKATDLRGVLNIARATARRAGTWYALSRTGDRDRKRAQRARDGRYRFPVRDASLTYPDPVSMAEQAERHRVPLTFVHEAYGVGPYAMKEPNTTPSVYGSGEGWTMPEPIPADRYPTDPNPASRITASMACVQELQALAAGSIQPRQQEQTAEPTAAEQAQQAREAWEAFKAKTAARD